MLYLIGMGLHDYLDISLRGLQILKNADRIYVELYTSFFGDLTCLEKLINKKITVLDRAGIEEHPHENIFRGLGLSGDSNTDNVALLIPGDPLIATTHIDLVLRAKKLGIQTGIIHASSIYTAVAETGLQIYKFGKTPSIVFPSPGYFPKSPYDVLQDNLKAGLHTLCLLDIRSEENRFMKVGEGIDILLRIEEMRKKEVFTEDTLCIGVARLGGAPGNSVIKAGTAKSLGNFDFGKPPHALIVPGTLHFMEEEALDLFR